MHVKLCCKDPHRDFREISPCHLGYGTGEASGYLHYLSTCSGMRLEARGLSPDTWYAATFQDPSGGCQFSRNGGVGIFGIRAIGTLEYADMGLFRADSHGRIDATLPTVSGLSSQQLGVDSVSMKPSLGEGEYSRISVLVRNVGLDSETRGPLGSGGEDSGDLLLPKTDLYEESPITFTAV
jgi:hypothetical protein